VGDEEGRVLGPGESNVGTIEGTERREHADVSLTGVLLLVDVAIRGPEVDRVLSHLDDAIGTCFHIESLGEGIVTEFSGEADLGGLDVIVGFHIFVVEEGENSFSDRSENNHDTLFCAVQGFADCDRYEIVASSGVDVDADDLIEADGGLKDLSVVIIEGGLGMFNVDG